LFRLAHLSDVHLLEPRSGVYGLAVQFVSVHRRLDAEARIAKLKRALATAVACGASHVVVSGDLTETGEPAQFELFAEVLHDSGVRPEDVTLVPGNHDAYGGVSAWRRAVEGPLARSRRRARRSPDGSSNATASPSCPWTSRVTSRS